MTDPASVERAAAGCELVFNAMGLPEQWVPDQGVFEQVNARGTETVVRAAAAAGARRVVHTSTIDVFHADRGTRLRRARRRRLPQGHRLRALQAARRGARARGRRRDRHRAGHRQPGGASTGPGPGGAATSLEQALLRPGDRAQPHRRAGAPAGRHGAGLLDRPRDRPAAGRRARGARRALHPLRRPHELPPAGCDGGRARRPREGAAGDAGRCSRRRSRPPARPARGSCASRRCCRGASCTSSSGTCAPGPPRPSASWAGCPPRSRRACARWCRRLPEVRRAEPADFPVAARLLHQSAADMYDRFAGGRERALRLLERSLARPGTASSARGRLAGRAGRARSRPGWPAFPVAEAVRRSTAFLRLALRSAPPWHWLPALRLYWVGGRAAPTPPRRRLLRRRARHRPGVPQARRRRRPARRRRSARPCARGLRSVALDTTEGNAEARALYAREGFEEVAYRPAARGLPGFVALVKPLS